MRSAAETSNVEIPDAVVIRVAREAALLARALVAGTGADPAVAHLSRIWDRVAVVAARAADRSRRVARLYDAAMPLTDRLLLGPGPSNPYPEVTAAFARPLLGHLDPDFLAILDETCDRLRTVFRTTNALTLPISGTGSAGMEACFVNLRRAGRHRDRRGQRRLRRADVRGRAALRRRGRARRRAVGVGARPAAAARRAARPARGPAARGRPRGDVDRRRERRRAAAGAAGHGHAAARRHRHVARRHPASTSTAGGSTPATPGTQKCLGVPPGLSPLTFSPRAVERVQTRSTPPQSWYLDLGLIGDYVGGARKYHHTAPTVDDRGAARRTRRRPRRGSRAGVGAAPGRRHAPPGWSRRAGLDADRRGGPPPAPAHVGPAARRASTRGRCGPSCSTSTGIEVGGGLGEFAGLAWRIGLMGHSARERSVTTLLGCAPRADLTGFWASRAERPSCRPPDRERRRRWLPSVAAPRPPAGPDPAPPPGLAAVRDLGRRHRRSSLASVLNVLGPDAPLAATTRTGLVPAIDRLDAAERNYRATSGVLQRIVNSDPTVACRRASPTLTALNTAGDSGVDAVPADRGRTARRAARCSERSERTARRALTAGRGVRHRSRSRPRTALPR